MPLVDYHRSGSIAHLKVQDMTNHELRCLMLALWWILGAGDRVDFIAEMRWYLQEDKTKMPVLTQDLIRAYENSD